MNNKKNLFFLIAPVLLFTSVLFFFGPVQMYLSNIGELWFGFSDVLWPSLLAWLVSALLLFVVGLLFQNNKKLFTGYCLLLCGLGLALYVQGNYIPNRFGILNGADIDWTGDKGKLIVNIGIWILLISVPFLIHYTIGKHIRNVVPMTACLLILVQVIALGTQCVLSDIKKPVASDSLITEKGLLEISEDKNIVIFVFDTFDQDFFMEVYKDPDYSTDFLDGFTYFNNATGPYPNTKAAMPYILTKVYYENQQTYTDYIDEAWKECAPYYETLKAEGFDISIYSNGTFISEEAKEKWVSNAIIAKEKVSSYPSLVLNMTKLAAMNSFPDILKRYVWLYKDPFDSLRQIDSSEALFNWEDSPFYEKLMNEKIVKSTGSKYKVIHLEGTHMPYTVREDLTEAEKDSGEATAITEAKGCMNILKEYIRQLKELGVYDNTMIIVTGDHGYSQEIKTKPIIFAKGFGDSGGLTFVEHPVSHSNLMATILEGIDKNDTEIYGNSLYIPQNAENVERRYLLYTLNDSYDTQYLPDMKEYRILPEGNDKEDYILTGRTYKPGKIEENVAYSYELGTDIDFDNMDSLVYFVSGIPSYVEDGSAWASGNRGRMCLRTGDISKDLIAHFEIGDYVQNNSQHIIISSAGETLFDETLSSGERYFNFIIPGKCVTDGLLVLDFEYPDACTSASLGHGEDDRLLSVRFTNIRIEAQKDGETIMAYKGGNIEEYALDGWHAPEGGFTWTSEKASIHVAGNSDADQTMTITYWTHPGAKDTAVYYNDNLIGTLPHHEESDATPVSLVLPKDFRVEGGLQTISLVTDGATTSKAYYGGDVTDTRVLGIAVSEIVFQ